MINLSQKDMTLINTTIRNYRIAGVIKKEQVPDLFRDLILLDRDRLQTAYHQSAFIRFNKISSNFDVERMIINGR